MNQNEHNELPLPGPSDIDAVLAFMPIFETPGFMFSTPDGELSDDAIRFVKTLNKHGFIRSSFNWPEWQHEAERYLNEPTAIESADLETICRLFTTHVRKNRFCEGHLASMFECGHCQAILQLLGQIHERT